MHRTLAAVLACALLVVACDGDPDGGPSEDESLFPSESASASPSATAPASPTESAAPSSDEPTDDASEIDVTTTPDEITPEWAEAVINTLLAEYGEIASEVLALPVVAEPDQIDPEFYDRTRELFDGQYEERRIQDLQELATDEDFVRSEILPAGQYGYIRSRVDVVRFAEPGCVVVVGPADSSQVRADGAVSDVLSAWSLALRESGTDANPTPWVLIDVLPNLDPDGEPLPDEMMLSATLDEFGDSLDTTCEGGQ